MSFAQNFQMMKCCPWFNLKEIRADVFLHASIISCLSNMLQQTVLYVWQWNIWITIQSKDGFFPHFLRGNHNKTVSPPANIKNKNIHTITLSFIPPAFLIFPEMIEIHPNSLSHSFFVKEINRMISCVFVETLQKFYSKASLL